MSEEDDWFERALRETDEESDERPVAGSESEDGGAESEDGGAESDDGEAESDDGGSESDGAEDAADGAEGAAGSAKPGTADAGRGPDDAEGVSDDPAREIGIGSDDSDGDPFGGVDADGADVLDGDDSGESDPFGGDDSGTGDLDGGDGGPDAPDADPAGGGLPADAFGDVDDVGSGSFGEDDPFGGGGDADVGSGAGGEHTGGGGTDSLGDDDPFGGSRSPGSGGSGGGGGGGGADNDPFGGYRGPSGGEGDEFGFGEFGGDDAGDAAEFDVDPEEFESEIERTDIGIKGLDDMILGGVPSRSLLSVIGGAGTGKTTFALQFLNHALERGEKGIYITLEQTKESIYDTADEKGWSFRDHAVEDRLAVVAIDPIEMANSLSSIRNDLVRLIAEFDADRLVLDSVSLLEMMYDHPAKRRSEVFGFTRALKDAGVTTLLTSEASEENPYASRHGIVEYLTDAVFVLQYIRGSDFRETRLAVEIQKIRDANHSRETKPYDITDTGISVYDQANIF